MASIGVLTLELRLENAHSLKEKRHVVKGLRDRLHNKFNVSVAEIDWQPDGTGGTSVPEEHPGDEDIEPGDTLIELRPDDDGNLVPHLYPGSA